MNNTTMTRRWQAAAKQGLCLLLCLLIFVTLLPVKAYAAAKVDRTQALARIAQLQKELEGKYFTTTGNPCNKPGTASHGCTKCTNANVIKASWFKKAVSLIPSTISKCPEGPIQHLKEDALIVDVKVVYRYVGSVDDALAQERLEAYEKAI